MVYDISRFDLSTAQLPSYDIGEKFVTKELIAGWGAELGIDAEKLETYITGRITAINEANAKRKDGDALKDKKVTSNEKKFMYLRELSRVAVNTRNHKLIDQINEAMIEATPGQKRHLAQKGQHSGPASDTAYARNAINRMPTLNLKVTQPEEFENQLDVSEQIAEQMWRGLDQFDLSRILQIYAAIIGKNKDLLSFAIERSAGFPDGYAQGELGKMVEWADKWASDPQVLKSLLPKVGLKDVKGTTLLSNVVDILTKAVSAVITFLLPKGIVGTISPKNYPGALADSVNVPAFLSGNIVYSKPATITAGANIVSEQAMHDAIKIYIKSEIAKGRDFRIHGRKDSAETREKNKNKLQINTKIHGQNGTYNIDLTNDEHLSYVARHVFGLVHGREVELASNNRINAVAAVTGSDVGVEQLDKLSKSALAEVKDDIGITTQHLEKLMSGSIEMGGNGWAYIDATYFANDEHATKAADACFKVFIQRMNQRCTGLRGIAFQEGSNEVFINRFMELFALENAKIDPTKAPKTHDSQGNEDLIGNIFVPGATYGPVMGDDAIKDTATQVRLAQEINVDMGREGKTERSTIVGGNALSPNETPGGDYCEYTAIKWYPGAHKDEQVVKALFAKEVFGPTLHVFVGVADEVEAARLFNRSPHKLITSIMSRDRKVQDEFFDLVKHGTVMVADSSDKSVEAKIAEEHGGVLGKDQTVFAPHGGPELAGGAGNGGLVSGTKHTRVKNMANISLADPERKAEVIDIAQTAEALENMPSMYKAAGAYARGAA